jgi:hypothetical protein
MKTLVRHIEAMEDLDFKKSDSRTTKKPWHNYWGGSRTEMGD